jgi:N-acetylglutamate synthase-like GNAT family acetyltransferase
MKLIEIGTDQHSIDACAELMLAAFPQAPHLNARYLSWLYAENPTGKVVGYNAWEDDKIIGHYACIPVATYLDGSPCTSLLALNTAMHPDFRNAGLIASLANKTYKLATQQGFSCVYAVANAASTPIFTRALKFQLVAPLTAAVGVINLKPDWGKALAGNRFRRDWSSTTSRWRAANPSNPVQLRSNKDNSIRSYARTHLPGMLAYGLMPPLSTPLDTASGWQMGLKVFMGLLPRGCCNYPAYVSIPERLKPSPLNFIYRPLADLAPKTLERDEVIVGFHDFDPY